MIETTADLCARLRSIQTAKPAPQTIDERLRYIRMSLELLDLIQETCGDAADFIEQTLRADVRPVVYCKDCKHAPEPDPDGPDYGVDVRFPDDACPFKCCDTWYNVRPSPEFFCRNGERREVTP